MIETTNHAIDPNDPNDPAYNYAASDVLSQYVWGTQYLDELVRIDRNTDVGTDDDCIDAEGSRSYYAHQDANYRTVMLTDTAGLVVERCEYTAYGVPTIYAGWSSSASGETAGARLVSTVGNPFLHQGLFYDREAGKYQNRRREHSARTGRFLQRDPLYADQLTMYEYLRSQPGGMIDALGLDSFDPIQWLVNAFSGGSSDPMGETRAQAEDWAGRQGGGPRNDDASGAGAAAVGGLSGDRNRGGRHPGKDAADRLANRRVNPLRDKQDVKAAIDAKKREINQLDHEKPPPTDKRDRMQKLKDELAELERAKSYYDKGNQDHGGGKIDHQIETNRYDSYGLPSLDYGPKFYLVPPTPLFWGPGLLNDILWLLGSGEQCLPAVEEATGVIAA